jgi:hypothetical protein
MLCEAFEEHSLSWTVVFEWHSRFKAGQVSVEDDECSGWQSTNKMTENVEKIWEVIHKYHHQIILELTDTVWISYGVCQETLTENLNMCCIAVKFCVASKHVPWATYKRRLTRTQLLSLGT